MWTDRTVLVTGGTGFLGSAVVRALAEAGARVRVAARQPEAAPTLAGLTIERYPADLRQPATFDAALTDCEIVIHTAVSYGSYSSQQQTNVAGTAALAQRATTAGVQRFVHISSLAALGYPTGGTIYEHTPALASHDPYSLTKRHGEAAIQAVRGLATTIIRPGAIYGAGAPLWTRTMFQLAVRRPFFFIGAGSGYLPLIHVDDVVSLVLKAALHPAAGGETFQAVHPRPIIWREFLTTYAALIQREITWRGLPPRLLTPLIRLIGATASTPTSRAALPELLAYLQGNAVYSMAKAHDLLDWQPTVSLTEGVARCLPYLKQQRLVAE